MDALDWSIVTELQRDGRLSWSALGRRVGLSPPAVAERVRRLEQSGVIAGYRAVVPPDAVGRPITAYVRTRVSGDGAWEALALAESRDEVLECHRITGDDCYLMKVAVGSVRQLESLLEELTRHGPTTTSIVLSTAVDHRVLDAPADATPEDEFRVRLG